MLSFFSAVANSGEQQIIVDCLEEVNKWEDMNKGAEDFVEGLLSGDVYWPVTGGGQNDNLGWTPDSPL